MINIEKNDEWIKKVEVGFAWWVSASGIVLLGIPSIYLHLHL